MKTDKKMQALYKKRMEERLIKIEKEILKDALNNPLLKRAGEVPNYFKGWIEGSKLVAVIPALDADNKKSKSYYSVGAINIKNGVEQDNIRISPVHMYINEEFYDIPEEPYNSLKKCFLFDSESEKLYNYEKKPHSQDYHFVRKPNFERIKQHIVDNPVVLFFQGCDDEHVGKRFKTKEEAFEYLQLIDVFEDIFDDDLQYHN